MEQNKKQNLKCGFENKKEKEKVQTNRRFLELTHGIQLFTDSIQFSHDDLKWVGNTLSIVSL